jgi:hypothetical protein
MVWFSGLTIAPQLQRGDARRASAERITAGESRQFRVWPDMERVSVYGRKSRQGSD